MSDTVAFFAKKKKKGKKAFKFNANKVDVSQVTSAIHVDAPALSSESDPLSLNTATTSKNNNDNSNGDWDENALSAKVAKAAVTPVGTGPAELMDMKALELKRTEQDDIAERMRVEETRAQLAAAKAGMEKEALRLKEEKEFKESKHYEQLSSSSGTKVTSDSGKWIPSHMRQNTGSSRLKISEGTRFGHVRGMGPATGYQRKVDTNDEMIFPDLATADKLIQEEEKQKQSQIRKLKTLPKKDKETKESIECEVKKTQEAEVKNEDCARLSPPPTITNSEIKLNTTTKKKKKKKKDVSTFKTS